MYISKMIVLLPLAGALSFLGAWACGRLIVKYEMYNHSFSLLGKSFSRIDPLPFLFPLTFATC